MSQSPLTLDILINKITQEVEVEDDDDDEDDDDSMDNETTEGDDQVTEFEIKLRGISNQP